MDRGKRIGDNFLMIMKGRGVLALRLVLFISLVIK